MEKRRTKPLVLASIVAIALAGGYTAYKAFSPPIGDNDSYHPTGRVVTVQRGDIPIGINSLGNVKNSSSIEVVTGVKEADVKKLKLGQKARIWLHEWATTVEGDIVNISDKPRIDGNETFYDVTIHVEEGPKVTDGAAAEVQFVLDNKQNVIMIPSLAVQQRDDGSRYVWVLPPNWEDKPGNKIKPIIREIKTGYMDERNAEVTYGLQEGERVVIPANQD